jgi:hypothetical protein
MMQKLNKDRRGPVTVVAGFPSHSCKLYFDGACRGNPGTAGIGFLLKDSKGQVIERFNHLLGYELTNNVAEYKALIAGVQHALDHGITNIEAQGDSELICKQKTRGSDAQKATFSAARAAAPILCTSYGPKGMDHMLQSPDDDVTIRLQGRVSRLLIAPEPKSSLSNCVRVMQMKRNPNGEKEATVLCRAEVNQQVLNPSRRCRSKTSYEITASFPLFIKTIVGSSLCLQVQDSHSVFELKTQIHQATGIPPIFQQLIFEGRQLGDGSLLRNYRNLKNATISLTSRLRGGVPLVTHPSSYKQAVKSGTSAPSKL